MLITEEKKIFQHNKVEKWVKLKIFFFHISYHALVWCIIWEIKEKMRISRIFTHLNENHENDPICIKICVLWQFDHQSGFCTETCVSVKIELKLIFLRHNRFCVNARKFIHIATLGGGNQWFRTIQAIRSTKFLS